ncbi:MAG: hypothetical protein VB007_00600 [Methanocorpusculum sp.]|uniref:hypothetical protein n=1 Tax=Methanocorpusculum sp. TaxID=2058474 RepID=UPI002A8981D0|nr:hypothetical protein [Methanocorpusculum sp.]MDY3203018.1 hypothetical protein [Methanocorpusculum sp.]MEA5085711.1 hypothetical protein [Methanocorpusculum sp.]
MIIKRYHTIKDTAICSTRPCFDQNFSGWKPEPRWMIPSSNTVEPIIVATNEKSLSLLRNPNFRCSRAFLRASEFITSDGKALTPLYYRTAAKGGFNVANNTDTPIALSLIMDDPRCSGLSARTVSRLINELKPAYCTTMDEATYLRDNSWSTHKLKQIRMKNRQLIKAHPEMKFIGVIKGSTVPQIRGHVSELQSLGIDQFIFHIGDYIAHGNAYELRCAKEFVQTIRDLVPTLYLYGMGSKEMIQTFPYVDGIITLNHIIEPHNGIFTDAQGRITHENGYNPTQKTLDYYIGTLPSLDHVRDDDVWNTFQRITRDFSDRKNSGYASAACLIDTMPGKSQIRLSSAKCRACLLHGRRVS